MNIKSIKKVFSILLTAIFLLSFTFTAYGSEKSLNNSSNIFSNIKNALYCLDRNAYGFSNIDFEQITVGNAIDSYEYVNNTLCTLDFILYPLTYNGELIAFAIKYDTIDPVQITKELVDKISSYIDPNKSFALIYDKNICYAYTDDGLISLCKTTMEKDNRQVLNNFSDKSFFKNTKLNNYAPVKSINDNSNSDTLDSTFSSTPHLNIINTTSSYVSCNVSFVSQNPPSNICWACSVACVGNYLTGRNLTGVNVATSLYDLIIIMV
ncbi:MAG: hypothetical protein K0S01_3884 [Herbinix sp.]|jgi:spore germination protein YaaH|nr:hypothetical protein [Herbinix sp.]